MEPGKSKICRISQHSGDPKKSTDAVVQVWKASTGRIPSCWGEASLGCLGQTISQPPLLPVFFPFCLHLCEISRNSVSLLISHSSLGGSLASNSKPKTSNCPEGKSCLPNISSALCGSLFLSPSHLGPSIPGCLSHFPKPSVRQLLLLLLFFIFYLSFLFVLTRIIGLVQTTIS